MILLVVEEHKGTVTIKRYCLPLSEGWMSMLVRYFITVNSCHNELMYGLAFIHIHLIQSLMKPDSVSHLRFNDRCSSHASCSIHTRLELYSFSCTVLTFNYHTKINIISWWNTVRKYDGKGLLLYSFNRVQTSLPLSFLCPLFFRIKKDANISIF